MAVQRRPNLFIIGAPKCGTTSIASWLSDHPQIYMSPDKEPRFFNTDLNYVKTTNEQDYLRLFEGAESHHSVIGEASVWYLFSETAVPNIEREMPGARYIVMLRNPVDMSYSLHGQLIFMGEEHIGAFDEAWRLSKRRRNGQCVSSLCQEPRLLDYASVCSLGSQMDRLFGIVPRDRVLALVLDDVRSDPRKEYLRVLRFLHVKQDGREQFHVENAAKVRRSQVLLALARMAADGKHRLGLHRGLGVLNALDKSNRRVRPRPEMSENIRSELQAYFKPEVEILSSLLNRDLTSWIK
jgi:hypothetical protein